MDGDLSWARWMQKEFLKNEADERKKLEKYEADYASYLKKKYFNDDPDVIKAVSSGCFYVDKTTGKVVIATREFETEAKADPDKSVGSSKAVTAKPTSIPDDEEVSYKNKA